MNFSDTSQISLLYRFDILHNACSKQVNSPQVNSPLKLLNLLKIFHSQMLRTKYYAAELDNFT